VRYTVKGSTPSASTACLKNTATPLGSSSFLPHAQKPGVPVPWLDNASTGESPEDAKESRTARGTVHGPAARQSARPCACAPALIQIDMQWASPRSVPTRPDLDIRLARYGGPAADTETRKAKCKACNVKKHGVQRQNMRLSLQTSGIDPSRRQACTLFSTGFRWSGTSCST
jgi:hypothetical protein